MDARIRYNRNKNREPRSVMITTKPDGYIYFGIARCNTKKDLFKKDVGKSIAIGRVMAAIEEYSDKSGEFIIHESGLRGRVKEEHVRDLLDYFDNLGNGVCEAKNEN